MGDNTSTREQLSQGHHGGEDFSCIHNKKQGKMPAPPPGAFGQQGPSCFDKMKMGFMMGFGVGCASGLLFGTIGGLRYGLRNMELAKQVTKTMFQGGGTFGTFMSVGTGIRC